MAVAIRIPYQRMTNGPIWKAMAPGELMVSGKIARRTSLRPMTARTFRRLLLVLVLCWLVLSLAAASGLRRLGPWLVVNEPLAKSDVIFVTDGGTPQRELEGAALFLEGWAPRVALTLARDALTEEVRGLTGEAAPQERSAHVLHRRGVPEAAVIRLGRTVDNTQQELEADFEHARARGYRRVIIVSSAYHTRRIR